VCNAARCRAILESLTGVNLPASKSPQVALMSQMKVYRTTRLGEVEPGRTADESGTNRSLETSAVRCPSSPTNLPGSRVAHAASRLSRDTEHIMNCRPGACSCGLGPDRYMTISVHTTSVHCIAHFGTILHRYTKSRLIARYSKPCGWAQT